MASTLNEAGGVIASQGFYPHGKSAPEPLVQLGAKSPGGLMLPEAKPSPASMYAPRGVAFLDGGGLAVCDTGNHRVLIWHSIPGDSHAPADVVLCQPDFYTEGAQAGGRGPENGLHLPCGIAQIQGRLYVCDAWNHRVLIWNQIPGESDRPPDGVIGQADLTGELKNRGGVIGPSGLDCPYGVGLIRGELAITDTQNRRVLVYKGVPASDAPARLVMGQDDFGSGEENRGTGPGPRTFRWPHAIATIGDTTWIADAGNHRLLGWRKGTELTADADALAGQEEPNTAWEMPHCAQGPARLRFPYSIASEAGVTLVADTANNRLLVYSGDLPDRGALAAGVLGQPSFDPGGENRWDSILPDTLCWPYGLALSGNRIAIADSGNNRVVLWTLPKSPPWPPPGAAE